MGISLPSMPYVSSKNAEKTARGVVSDNAMMMTGEEKVEGAARRKCRRTSANTRGVPTHVW